MHATDFGRSLAVRLQTLQDELCDVLGGLDGGRFGDDRWTREQGGGGRSRVLEDGALIEKGGVLFSGINGSPLPDVVRREHPGLLADAVYFATGVSLIVHPRSPYVPTVHFNVRYFEVGDVYWFGGGMDLTPYYAFREDCIHFHRTVKSACDRVDLAYYPRFKPACDRYFYLRHRDEPRGIGGIFFNYLKDDRARSGEFVLALGRALLAAYVPIVERRRGVPYGERERAFQAYRRGRYVEFNLLYDQGTLFGLQSGGRTESILASLPPQVAWRYDWQPHPDSPEAALARDFLPPRDWAAEH
ncbi:MAG: oxygen-dependent coproporphyrinogen oxidase [Candidatus Lambdaproteobacteria bacterium]|nr:oxygen-dependent coproporphyrinogen oxidase [Candidatus Lambdaproteobacteria bacterium]